MLSVIADRAHGGSQDPMAFPLDARQFRRLEEVDPRELSVAVSTDLGEAISLEGDQSAVRGSSECLGEASGPG